MKGSASYMEIVLISHGSLCEGVLGAYRMLTGSADGVDTLSLTQEGGVSQFSEQFGALMDEKLRDGGSVLVMCDLQGGTPYNQAYARFLQDPEHIRVVTGLNLPMLVETLLSGPDDLEGAYQLALKAGREGVTGAEEPAEEEFSEDDLF